MGMVSVYMTGNYLRQPGDVDVVGPLDLMSWSQLAISLQFALLVMIDISKQIIHFKTDNTFRLLGY